MANTAVNLITDGIGGGAIHTFDLPVDGGSHIFKGSLVSQLTATGMVVPYSTAAAGVCVGVAQHEQDNSAGADGAKRIRIETKRTYALTNGAGGDAFSEASLIGSIVFGTDDHTVADNSANSANRAIGFFMGMESDGKVRVFVDPSGATLADNLAGGNIARLQVAGGTFAAGTATIATGITVTASTDAFVIMSAVVTGSINVGCFAHLKASNVVGAPGTGSVIVKILGDDGAVDADAAGAFRVLLVN
jgi:hypothetical protein